MYVLIKDSSTLLSEDTFTLLLFYCEIQVISV